MSNTPHPKLDADFMRALNFTMEDLEANRQGYMTELQKRVLKNTRFSYLLSAGTLSILLLLPLVGLLLMRNSLENKGNDWLWSYLTLTFLILFCIPIFMYLNYESKIMYDLRHKKVKFQQGKVIIDIKRSNGRRGTTYLEVKMDNLVFNTSHEVALRFRHLDHYIIYYAPHSKVILSAEPIDPA